MRLPAAAAGCDGPDEFELLLQLGCGYAEGRFIAEPRGADGLAAWDGRWRPPSADGG